MKEELKKLYIELRSAENRHTIARESAMEAFEEKKSIEGKLLNALAKEAGFDEHNAYLFKSVN